jgi:hypothetical protein
MNNSCYFADEIRSAVPDGWQGGTFIPSNS